jgi:hypothetical protein
VNLPSLSYSSNWPISLTASDADSGPSRAREAYALLCDYDDSPFNERLSSCSSFLRLASTKCSLTVLFSSPYACMKCYHRVKRGVIEMQRKTVV